MSNTWKAYLKDEPHSLCINLYFVRDCGDKIEYMFVENGEPVLEKKKVFQHIRPFFTFPHGIAKELLQSLAEALDKFGCEIPSSKYHLEDMRTLMKLRKS